VDSFVDLNLFFSSLSLSFDEPISLIDSPRVQEFVRYVLAFPSEASGFRQILEEVLTENSLANVEVRVHRRLMVFTAHEVNIFL
jgi:hypothetical protein